MVHMSDITNFIHHIHLPKQLFWYKIEYYLWARQFWLFTITLILIWLSILQTSLPF
jgi:hypothetical protein